MHHPSNYLITAALIALGALGLAACTDSTQPAASAPTGGPRFTMGSGLTNIPLARSTIESVNVHSEVNGFRSELKVKDAWDAVVTQNSMAVGGYTGWHSHPGVLIIAIKAGALTLYRAEDPNCEGTVYSAGSGFVEQGGDVRNARNEGSEVVQWVVTYIVPVGGATRIDEADPGNCAF